MVKYIDVREMADGGMENDLHFRTFSCPCSKQSKFTHCQPFDQWTTLSTNSATATHLMNEWMTDTQTNDVQVDTIPKEIHQCDKQTFVLQRFMKSKPNFPPISVFSLEILLLVNHINDRDRIFGMVQTGVVLVV